MAFGINFYQDVVAHDQSAPCKKHPRLYRTLEEAEEAAVKAMPLIRRQFGVTAGYVVFDSEGYTVATGPGST
jgi:hypothetical protein